VVFSEETDRKSMDISKAFKSDRVLKSLTGMNRAEFEELAILFELVLLETSASKKRKRAPGAGRRGVLKEARWKLFFILFYLKVYPTYDLAGFFFGTDKCQPCRWVQMFLPVLERVLGRRCALPKRKICSVEEFLAFFPDVADLFLDGTERRVQRPQSAKKQKNCYSGKKKTHTRKNIVATDKDKRILFVSPTKNGRRHDKHLLDKAGWLSAIPPGVTLWVDTGFQGIEHMLNPCVSVMRPTKRNKGKTLTLEQKQENKTISSIRIVVENAIAGIKRFGVLSQLFRNRNGQDDKFFFLSAALWNFHLQFA